ncbi:transmembrane amino acid transporter protein-domain-containing protein, partial [Kickxella alabastrina]|uniref:transmembrane amino acid transporter protein-domain-containing protein n=1 Tax=Kickxella alabastrina TaxID=61397 RepID=UPI00221F3D52
PTKGIFFAATSLIGSGMLFLPQAFRNAGLFFSAIIIVFSGFASLFTLNQLINIGYGDLARRAYGTRMESVVNASIIMLYLGYSCVGSAFVATNLRDSFNDLTGCRWHTLSLGFWIAIQGIVLIPLCLIRHMRGFSRVSLVANVFVFVGLTYVLSISSRMLMQRGYGPNVKHFNSANVPLFLGSAVYTYSNHGFVLPVVAAMRQPEKMPCLLVLAISTCALLSLTVGGISYAAFGDTTQQIILINMPPEAIATQVIRVIYAMAVAGAIPMTMYPVYKALESFYFSIASGKHNSCVKFGKNMFRITLIVSVLTVAAVGADRLDLFVSVIGGVACVPLGFVYPPLIH